LDQFFLDQIFQDHSNFLNPTNPINLVGFFQAHGRPGQAKVRYLRLKRYRPKNFASFPFEISHGKNFFRPSGGGILAAAAEKNFASFPLSDENF
jgi:hypothetical protein